MAPPEAPHTLVETAAGPWRGPTYSYRGARIECLPGAHVCGLFLPGHPLDGLNFGVAGTIAPLIDSRPDQGRLPDHMRPALKASHRVEIHNKALGR